MFAYNSGAALVWNEWVAGNSPAQIARAIARDAGLPRDLAKLQVDGIIDHWKSTGLFPGARVPAPRPPRRPALRRGRKQHPEPAWAAHWTCGIGRLAVRFAIEPQRLVSTIRILFRHLEIAETRPDLTIEIRRTGPSEAALIADGTELMRAPVPTGFKDAVHRAILQRLYPRFEWFAVLHAGALARGETGIAFPAESGSGKTTLIAYLMSEGYEYYADDLVALAPDHGLILPWPLPLSVKSRSWNLVTSLYPELSGSYAFRTKGDRARLLLPPADSWNRPPVPLRNVVFPRFDEKAETSLRPIAPLDVLERLLSGRAWLGHPLRADRVKKFLAWIGTARGFVLTFNDVKQAAQQLEALRL